ncbi:amino acid adenylation domain-containing protein [Micromonospora sp. NPDC048868]|uniref:amino acid adenylation domain-containing protein n=1 Tax=Micromonospora sp. NPDC048868 TaxID=3364258 RepID=UPI003720630E
MGDGWSLTYAALDAHVDALCARLRGEGARTGDRVGLAVERGALPLVASAAIMRLGCTYVPLDVRHPADRLAYLVGDSEIRLAVTDVAGASALAGAPVTAMKVDQDELRARPSPTPQPPSEVNPSSGAYLMYTSGSTGRPKGVEITHGNALALLQDALPLFGYGDDELWPLQHGHGFDVSVWEMWAGVAVGATLLAVPPTAAGDPERMLELLLRHRATRLHVVPSVFRHLAETAHEERLTVPLRSVVFCGEAVSYDAIKLWNEAHGPVDRPQWCNVYGITETTVYNTIAQLSADQVERADSAAPIGQGYATSPVVVLREDLRPTAPHEVGEIFVGGRQVAAGYLKNAALTAERFLTLPDRPGTWYRTGDLGTAEPDGMLRCLGRRDEQVKVRGHRIELGEIDHALRALPWLRDGAVVAHPSARGDAMLTAFLVPESGLDAAPRALLYRVRRDLSALLPEHMLPNRVEALDHLPVNPNGKTDRRALRDLAAPGRR